MLQRAYSVFADVLTLAAQLGSAQELPAPDVLRQRISGLFEVTSQKAKQAGFTDLDVRESIYAVAAFMDEQILRSGWSGRQQWMSQPLQLVYFNENTAGEGFFQRLEALRATPGREHVTAVYFLCIALGFSGKYAVLGGGGGELQGIEAQTSAVLQRQFSSSEHVSPHGYPQDVLSGGNRRKLPVVAIALGVLGAAILAYVGLTVSIGWKAYDAADELREDSKSLDASGPSVGREKGDRG